VCDGPDSCDAGGVCLANHFPATRLCRADAGECDVAEFCDGAGACPADAFEAEFTPCGADEDKDCDAADSCSANGACVDRIDPSATLCRDDAGECDVPEYCDGVVKTCGPDGFETAGTACGNPTDTACTNPDSCDGVGACAANNEACALVTDSDLCPFDVGPERTVCDRPGEDAFTDQFSLNYTPVVEGYPGGYRLSSGLPDGTFYNAVVDGTPGSTVTVSLRVPYPYVTVGTRPLQVFDGAELSTDPSTSCLKPLGSALATSGVQIKLSNYLAFCDRPLGLCRNGVGGCTSDADCVRPNAQGVSCIAPTGTACDASTGPDTGGSCSFALSVEIPASGQAYLNLHLDYGVQGAGVDLCQEGEPEQYDAGPNETVGGVDALESTAPGPATGDVAIANCTNYTFRHRAGVLPALEATVENLNLFGPCTDAADRDCDAMEDAADLCPYYSGNDPDANADGDDRGDECECTDQSGDGHNTVTDLVKINEAIFRPALATPLCDGNNDRVCDVSDILAANIELFSLGSSSVCAFQPVPGP
jgi:hypothetical protein